MQNRDRNSLIRAAWLLPAAAMIVLATTDVSAQQAKGRALPMMKGGLALSLAPVLEKAIPAVVAVRVLGERQKPVVIAASSTPGGDPMVTQPEKEPFRSGGSGVIIDAKAGIIITNNHVIADQVRIEIGLSDGRNFPAKLLGTDPATDVAVLKIEATGLIAMPIGDSDKLKVGDFVMAIGNPFGLEGSASQGIVSATMRSDIGYGAFEDFIQTDAAINPGNSGGALIDIDGRLIGINTATGSGKTRSQGISFAIPINMARAIAGELRDKGVFNRGGLGILPEELTMERAAGRKLTTVRGAYIAQVTPGSVPERLGIKVGDIIVSSGGRPVRSMWDHVTRVISTPIGRTLDLVVVTESGQRRFTVPVVDFKSQPTPVRPPDTLTSLKGIELGLLLPGFPAFGTTRGARVLTVAEGPLARLGLKPDDVITAVDGSTVSTPQEVFEAAASKMGKFRLEILRGDRRAWVYLGG